MNNFELYTEVQLARDLPELGFIRGDVATIVDIVTTGNGEKGYCLEFFDNHGQTLDVAVLEEAAIHKPLEHGVVHYRQYQH